MSPEQIKNANPDLSVYPKSFAVSGDISCAMVKTGAGDALAVSGTDKFSGVEVGGIKLCPLSNENAAAMLEVFPFTAPSRHKGIPFTIGLGDRLGLASSGHIKAVSGRNAFPVLAQQSMRELNLTGRKYEDVLSAAAFAVFREGWKSGYGADGDHLKTRDEINYALSCGFTMITLDVSEHIDNAAAALTDSECAEKYKLLDEKTRRYYESKYAGKVFSNKGIAFTIDEATLARTVLIYDAAIKHTISIYNDVLRRKNIDFEMSIDETLSTTLPAAHFVVASELCDADIEIVSLAPRFCGEFQKGIDYIGDTSLFARQFEAHAGIADALGYKISVHSGSDKFTVFPAVAKYTGGCVHVKTAGTNWLEALKIIAAYDSDLYRGIHKYALENLSEARKYYHISSDPAGIPDINGKDDNNLPAYFDRDDSRQAMHISYGLILNAKNDDGSYRFKDKIYSVLSAERDKYDEALVKHIGRHLELLGK